MNLIEPLALLHGADASKAVGAGLALPLCGTMAFALARLIEPDGASRLVAAGDMPQAWLAQAAVLASAVDWAGLDPGPQVMGILNATPDSFSDGGRHLDPAAAIEAGRTMRAAGAAILDVGGESTRPGAAPVPPEEERRRILPVISALAAEGALISVDTRNASTMRAALAAGAGIVNDVSALAYDPDAAAVVAEAGCPVVLMHMRGTPASMRGEAGYDDLVPEVVRELGARVAAAEAACIDRRLIAVDPGIGFAKEGVQNAEMLRRLGLLLNLGCAIVVGVSRKRFIGHLAGEAASSATARMPGSIAAALCSITQACRVIRAHDVADTIQAVRVWTGLAGMTTRDAP